MRPMRMRRLDRGSRRGCRVPRHTAVVIAALAMLVLSAAESPAQEPAPPSAGAPFQPGEISIGEPVTLPFGAPSAVSPSRGAADRAGTAAGRTGDESPAAVSRSGWLGMVVAESNVPGRWRVDEVVAGGPAELAGIRVGDELRAVNGVAPRNADEVSEALTAIVADQTVRLAIGRGDEVSDMLLRAVPRPAVAPRAPSAAAPGAAVPAPEAATTVADAGTAPLPGSLPAFDAPPTVTVAPPSATLPVAPPFPVTTTPPVFEPASPPPDVTAPVAAAPPAALEPPPAAWAEPRTPGFQPQPPRFQTPEFRAESAAPPPAAGFGPASPGWSSGPPVPAALPSDRVATAAPTSGRRAALGVRTIPIDPVTQARFQLAEPVGAYVIGVVQDLPASRAGVPPGSVIVAIDERPVLSPAELTSLVTSSPVDRPITVRFLLPGGTPRDAAVVLQAIDPPLLQALGAGEPAPVGADAGARVARRPVDEAVTSLRREIGILRESLQQLERRLDRLAAGRR